MSEPALDMITKGMVRGEGKKKEGRKDHGQVRNGIARKRGNREGVGEKWRR